MQIKMPTDIRGYLIAPKAAGATMPYASIMVYAEADGMPEQRVRLAASLATNSMRR